MSKTCAVCGEPLDSGLVVHSGCVTRWIPVSEGLPDGDDEVIYCLVCLVDMVDGYMGGDGETLRKATEAVFLKKQKLWMFHPDAFDCFAHEPVNALVGEREFIGEDGEWLDTGSFVTHWMPMPKPPKEGVRNG